jgi:ankyrin repeat protein
VERTADDYFRAAWEGREEDVLAYLDGGGDANAQSAAGIGALVTRDPGMVRLLLSRGADPDLVFPAGGTALTFHAFEANVDAMEALIEAEADPNLPNREGERPLHALLSKPTDLDRRLTGLHLLLSEEADPNARTEIGLVTYCFMRDVRTVAETPLHRAAAYGSIEIIRTLIEADADPSLRDAHGESPLSWASRHWRDGDILRLLLFGEYAGTIPAGTDCS